ncbi:MAG: hypothetical protein R3F33_03705 [Planctomycetota bacterium]
MACKSGLPGRAAAYLFPTLFLAACGSSSDPSFQVTAGADSTVYERGTATLSASVLNEQGTPTWQWTQVSGPAVTLSDPATASPTFEVPELGAGETVDLVFQVTATDDRGAPQQASMTVHAEALDMFVFASGEGPVNLKGWRTVDGTVVDLTHFTQATAFIRELHVDALNRIYFVTRLTGTDTDLLYQLDPAGGDPVALLADGTDWREVNGLRSSQNGRYISWFIESLGTDRGLWLLDTETNLQTKIYDGAGNNYWTEDWNLSPDGLYLVILLNKGLGGRMLLSYDMVAETTMEISEDPSINSISGASLWRFIGPGHDLIYRSDEGSAGKLRLRVGSASSATSQVISGPVTGMGYVERYVMSPDELMVAYRSSEEDGTSFQLHSVQIDGGNLRRLNPDLESNMNVGLTYTWRPDGNSVIYEARVVGSDAWEEFESRVDGTQVTTVSPPLTTDGFASYGKPPFATNGNLVLTAYEGAFYIGQPYVYDSNLPGPVPLWSGIPASYSVWDLFPSEQSANILMVVEDTNNSSSLVYRVQSDGTGLEWLDQTASLTGYVEQFYKQGEWLVLMRDDGVGGYAPQLVHTDGTVVTPTGALPTESIQGYQGSPDGHFGVYQGETNGDYFQYAIDFDAGTCFEVEGVHESLVGDPEGVWLQ